MKDKFLNYCDLYKVNYWFSACKQTHCWSEDQVVIHWELTSLWDKHLVLSYRGI